MSPTLQRNFAHFLWGTTAIFAGLNALSFGYHAATGQGSLLLINLGALLINAGTFWMADRLLRNAPVRGERVVEHGEPDDPPPTDHFGLRSWSWDVELRELRSPTRGTVWHTPELRCEVWIEGDVVRGHAGIHAAHLPADWTRHSNKEVGTSRAAALTFTPDRGYHVLVPIYGVVERFGRFVQGTEGWRAEWVIIRKLLAPTMEIGLQLEEKFPDVEIVYE